MAFNQASMAPTNDNNNKIQEVLAYLRSIDVDALKQQHQEQPDGAGDVLTLLAEARTLVRRLESPFQYVHGVTTHATQLAHAMVVLDDLGVWVAWQEMAGGVGVAARPGGRRRDGGKEEEEEERASSLTKLWERCVVTAPCDIALLRESCPLFPPLFPFFSRFFCCHVNSILSAEREELGRILIFFLWGNKKKERKKKENKSS